MVNKPPSLADDVVAFRDDAPTSSKFRKALQRDGKMLLALANARLLALALSLPAEPDKDASWSLAPDEDLISYLLNNLSDGKRRELEGGVRGNPRAFKRLLELHHALVGEAGQEVAAIPSSWQHLESREQLGTVRFRPANGHLEFAPDDVMRSMLDLGQVDILGPEAPELKENARRIVEVEALKNAHIVAKRMAWARRDVSKAKSLLQSQTTEPLRDLLGAAERLADVLQVARKSSPRTNPEDFDEISGLVDAARELAERVSQAANSVAPLDKPIKQTHQVLGDALQSNAPYLSYALRASLGSSSDAEWRSNLRLQNTNMIISVSGSSGRPMQLKLALHSPNGAPLSGRLATLVRPQQTFDSVETDNYGICKLPLSAGESILLLEGDPPLELGLHSDA